MKYLGWIFTIVVLSGCGSETTGPKISPSLSPINFGEERINSGVTDWDVHLWLFNKGDEILKIESVSIIGDKNCSLTIEGPDRDKVTDTADPALVSIRYLPTLETEDQAALVIRSNAVNYPKLIIPICGRGVAEGNQGKQPPLVCKLPPESQADCEE